MATSRIVDPGKNVRWPKRSTEMHGIETKLNIHLFNEMSHIFNVRSFDPEIIIRAKAKKILA